MICSSDCATECFSSGFRLCCFVAGGGIAFAEFCADDFEIDCFDGWAVGKGALLGAVVYEYVEDGLVEEAE